MRNILSAALLAALCQFSYAEVVINEIMQSNIDEVIDDRNEFPDSWVEIYNSGTSAISLSNYSLGITKERSEAWPLPAVSVPAGGYQLIYCDKEANSLHTHFRLESGKGCSVYLFREDNIIDSVEGLKKQPAPNIAYGRETDGSLTWGYQAEPTPRRTNCGELCTEVLGNPVFSEPGRVITGNDKLVLHIGLPEGAPEGTVVRYTTDGSEPTAASNQFPEAGLTINTTRVVRAKAFCQGYLSPRSLTQSYIFFPRNFTLPIVSIVTNDTYFNGSKFGIYVDGNYGGGKKNYEYDWRRPINLELFTAEGEVSQLNQLCETRIAGAASRGCQLKSLALYANKRFGEKRFKYEFFPEQRPGVTDYKSVMFRNAGNDFDYLYMRDAIIQAVMAEHTDIDYQAWRPAIFYLNGKYMGMLNFRERSNEDNIYTNYDGLEDIDMIENYWELKSGTWDHWRAFETFFNEHGHTWEEYAQYLDMEEYLNVMILNLFFCNLDFPGNNIVYWRPRTTDGRWRIIVKDTDFGLGLYGRDVNYETLKWINNADFDYNNNWANKWEHTRLFRRLEEDETFLREFIDRTAIYMGDFMNYEGTWEVWEPMYNQISYEYPNHRKLINQWWPNYNDELNSAKTWLRNRTGSFYNQLASYYGLGTPATFKVNTQLSKDQRQNLEVEINGVRLSRHKLDGKFFQGRKLTLHATHADGTGVAGWRLTIVGNDGKTQTQTVAGETYEFNMPQCKSCEAEVILDPAAITLVEADQNLQPVAIYDLRGVRQPSLKPGQNVMVMSNGQVQKVHY